LGEREQMSNDQNAGQKCEVEKYFFRATSEELKKLPGAPIAYWVNEKVAAVFSESRSFESIGKTRRGLQTGDAERFVRAWHEVEKRKIGFGFTKQAAKSSGKKWFPFNSGGSFRKWYGNIEDVVNWEDDGADIKATGKAIIPSESLYFVQAITWPKVSSGVCSFRWFPAGIIPGDAGPCYYDESGLMETVLCFSNSKVALSFLQFLSPTLNFEVGVMAKMPIIVPSGDLARRVFREAVSAHKTDWNESERSFDFSELPLLHADYRKLTVEDSYEKLRRRWLEVTLAIRKLEQENNQSFVDAYGLQDELTSEVPIGEITLTCNPHYRYGSDKTEEALEALLRADTMRELVSYAVGCMLGRYSVDKPGLILANQGETLVDYLAQVPQPTFPADDDNVIPVLDGDWFTDDITQRFRQFLRVAFRDVHYDENLAFIERALNFKGKRNYSLRDYFLGEFYADHVKRYKKRPIYWLFSSPKGSFNALVYLHRYRPDTVSVVLRYLRDFRKKVADEKDRQAAASINPAVAQGDRTRALKETDRLSKVLTELDDYERDVLYPLATEQIEIDLDDGVKVNYLKFGAALKKIVGLEAKDED
jgi:hypothetical protein